MRLLPEQYNGCVVRVQAQNGQHPGVSSSLLRLVFCGYYLMKLPVPQRVRRLFLKLDTNVLVLLLSCEPGPPTPFYSG